MSKIKSIPNEALNNTNGGWGRFGGFGGGAWGGGYGALARAAEWNAIGSALAPAPAYPYYPAPYPYWR
jgi:hypothetical protein